MCAAAFPAMIDLLMVTDRFVSLAQFIFFIKVSSKHELSSHCSYEVGKI
jgi:hypothetical protein